MPNTALIIVDYQNDFLPGGALAAPSADDALRRAIFAEAARRDVKLIVFSRDWHPENHVSFAMNPAFEDMSWPTHCVAGTRGAQIESQLWEEILALGKPVLVVNKGVDPDKEAYSAFEGEVVESHGANDFIGQDLATALHSLGIKLILVSGLVTEYCVYYTAIRGLNTGFDTSIYLEEIRGLNEINSIRTILRLAKAGVVIV